MAYHHDTYHPACMVPSIQVPASLTRDQQNLAKGTCFSAQDPLSLGISQSYPFWGLHLSRVLPLSINIAVICHFRNPGFQPLSNVTLLPPTLSPSLLFVYWACFRIFWLTWVFIGHGGGTTLSSFCFLPGKSPPDRERLRLWILGLILWWKDGMGENIQEENTSKDISKKKK